MGAKQTNAQTQARQRNKQMAESAGRRSLLKFKQHRQERQRQRRLQNDFIFNRRISREFRFIQLVKSVRNIPNRICKTASKFKKTF